MYKALIFDRDGTLNTFSKDRYVLDLRDFYLFPDVKSTLSELGRSRRLGVVTNQKCIGLGLVDWSTVFSFHKSLSEEISMQLNDFPILICPHLENSCKCRKPNGYNLHRMARILNVKVSECLYVGDKCSDFLAAREVGMNFMLIDRTHSPLIQEFYLGSDVRVIHSLKELLSL